MAVTDILTSSEVQELSYEEPIPLTGSTTSVSEVRRMSIASPRVGTILSYICVVLSPGRSD